MYGGCALGYLHHPENAEPLRGVNKGERLRGFDPEGESVNRPQTYSIPRTSPTSVKLFLPCRGPKLPLHNGNAAHIEVGYDCRCAIGGAFYYSFGS